MKPVELPGAPKDQWAIGNAAKGYIVYSNTNAGIRLDLPANTNYKIQWLDPRTGQATAGSEQVKGAKGVEIKNPSSGAAILWLSRI